MKLKFAFSLVAGLFFTGAGLAQNNVGIGTTTPNPNAILEMQSTTQGVLVPRMTTVQRGAIAAPTEGLLVYDTDLNCFYYFETASGAWQSLCAGGSGTPGPQGPQGPAGPAGAMGATGATGPAGATGATGAAGPTGSQGPSGTGITSTVNNGDGTYTFNYSDGTSFTTGNLNGAPGAAGPQGPAGAAGPQGSSGTGITSTVNNGDGTYTFNYSDGTSFTTGNLNGAPGAAGPQGPAGATGPQGPSGTGVSSTVNNGDGTYTFNYSDGTSFTTGNLNGSPGAAGPQGPAGATGATGSAGATGPAGPAGATGATGATGPQGPSGVINKYHRYGSAGRLAVTSTTATLQPGLTQTFTLSATSTVMVVATVGGRTTGTTTGQYAVVDMVLYADGNFLPSGGWNRFSVVNGTNANAFNTGALNTMITLGAGTHTIELRTMRSSGNVSVDIGGNATTDVNPGELSILILN